MQIVPAKLTVSIDQEADLIIAMLSLKGSDFFVSAMSTSLAKRSPEARQAWEDAVQKMVRLGLEQPGVGVEIMPPLEAN